jgi:hypothetical protein
VTANVVKNLLVARPVLPKPTLECARAGRKLMCDLVGAGALARHAFGDGLANIVKETVATLLSDLLVEAGEQREEQVGVVLTKGVSKTRSSKTSASRLARNLSGQPKNRISIASSARTRVSSTRFGASAWPEPRWSSKSSVANMASTRRGGGGDDAFNQTVETATSFEECSWFKSCGPQRRL